MLYQHRPVRLVTEIVLRRDVSLLGGYAKPAYGLGVIFGHSFTINILVTEIVLRRDVSLLCGHAIPTHGLGIIFGHSFTIRIHVTEIVLRRVSVPASITGTVDPL